MVFFQSLSLVGLISVHIFSSVRGLEVSPQIFAKGSYDFVIVGGGTAGLALATRLTDDPKIRVGVIEAGVARLDDKVLIPGLYTESPTTPTVLGDSNYDWNFLTVPQSRLDGRQLPMHSGKMLGGSSGINGMAHARASKIEYDGFETLGNPGWNFDVLQSAMKSSENWTAPSAFVQETYFANNDPKDHGTRGAIKDGAYSFYYDVVKPFFQANVNRNISINTAMSSGNQRGVWTIDASIDTKNVTRSFSYNGYYLPHAQRTNLVIVTASKVTKVKTNRVHGLVTASAVEYTSGNKTYSVQVKGEVILSAGPMQTPQLLELSGIGNKTLLNSLSIPVVLDLPGVGENTQDHFGVSMAFQSLDGFITPDTAINDPAFAAQQMQEYLANRTGIYSAIGATTLAFLSMQDFTSPETAASLLSDLDGALKDQPSHYRKQFALQREWLNDPNVPQVEVVLFATLPIGIPEPGKSYYTLIVFSQHLWSRGSIHINTTNPLVPPQIDGQYMNSPGDFDMKLLIEAIKWTLQLSQTEPLKNVTLAVLNPSLNATDDELRDFVVSSGSTEWHITGTAAMLPRDQNGVVDAQLKVYGTSNIRVVDASIIPIHIATHPSQTVYGIAERAAAALRNGEWK